MSAGGKLSRFLLIFIPLIVLCLVAIGAYLYADALRLRQSIESNEERIVSLLGRFLGEELARVHGDVQYLASQSILERFLRGETHLADAISADYARFATRREFYEQIRILDPTGSELVRVNYRDGRASIVDHESLSDKGERYYFHEAMAMPPGQVYVSPFDLNVEAGRVEQPLRPVIRFAIGIDATGGRRLGVLVLNFDGRSLLEAFRRLSAESRGKIWLLNAGSYWLSSPVESDQWGFMRSDGDGASLKSRFPTVWQALWNQDTRKVSVDGALLTQARLCGITDCSTVESASTAPTYKLPYDASDLPWRIASHIPAAAASGLGLVSPQVGVLLAFIAVLLIVAGLAAIAAWRMAHALESLKITDAALLRSEERFRVLLEAAPDAIIISDDDGRIVHANERASKDFGYEPDALLSRRIDDLVPIDVRGRHAALRAGYMSHPETRVVRPVVDMHGLRADGSEFPVEISLAPVETDAGLLVMSVIRDRSQQHEMEAQFRQSQKMEAIGQLTGGMAHDFNNLLGIIIGNLDLLDRNLSGDDLAGRRLASARKAALRGADLTSRMLAVARRQSLQPQATDVNDVIRDIVAILPRTLGPDIELSLELDESVPAVMVDRSQLENALLNLALNARDAMPSGGRLYIRTEAVDLDADYAPAQNGDIVPGWYVRISISDTGSGMSQDTLQRAFEPFFTTKQPGKGTGLGLAMIYGFIKQSRGNIRMYSEPGEGTTVKAYLPATEQTVDACRGTGKDEEHRVGGRETILVVDDEVDLLDIAVTCLEEAGYTVYASPDGHTALEILARHPETDLLLTDVVMPGGLHGVALAEKARERVATIQVVYTSGFPSNVLADKVELKLDAPMVGKPYRRDELLRRVREVLDAG